MARLDLVLRILAMLDQGIETADALPWLRRLVGRFFLGGDWDLGGIGRWKVLAG